MHNHVVTLGHDLNGNEDPLSEEVYVGWATWERQLLGVISRVIMPEYGYFYGRGWWIKKDEARRIGVPEEELNDNQAWVSYWVEERTINKMVKRYEKITRFLEILDEDHSGEWVIDNTSKGTKDDPIQFPWVAYSDEMRSFIQVFYDGFIDMEYLKNLENLGFASQNFESIDVSDLEGEHVCTLLTAGIRGDRFCEGLLLELVDNGTVAKWLMRLKEIDDNTGF